MIIIRIIFFILTLIVATQLGLITIKLLGSIGVVFVFIDNLVFSAIAVLIDDKLED